MQMHGGQLHISREVLRIRVFAPWPLVGLQDWYVPSSHDTRVNAWEPSKDAWKVGYEVPGVTPVGES